jgi:aconitate hydratase
MNVTYKILKNHLLEGTLSFGQEIKIKIDQTLTQDTTGTMVYLQLQALDVPTKKTELSVAYIDHNTLQTSYVNADDHEYIKSIALQHGVIYSKAGNGICHQVHLERFSKPGITLIGSDSHTPTSGGIGAISIGAGGLDVSIAIAKGYYYMEVPKVVNVYLINQLNPFVSAKDIILSILKDLTVKGGVGTIFEYSGPGLSTLSVTDRATIANMGAELGATTSIFPSDELTKDFLKRQKREDDFIEFSADVDAVYEERIVVDLSTIVPFTAKPHMPDNVVPVTDVPIKIDQVIIGSCTNSSYTDMLRVASILKNKKVHSDVSLSIAPGSSNILEMLAENGALADMIKSGARILESACGPCIGMGQAPKSNGVSLRTMNRNFKGRSGTMNANVYLVSPETAAHSSVLGYLSDPRELDSFEPISLPETFHTNDHYFVFPSKEDKNRKPVIGPNIKPFPLGKELEKTIAKTVLLKLGDNITTDDITPSNAELLPYRSNIPYLSQYCFGTVSDNFKELSETYKGGIVIAGENYGQGSSREHAALVPLYLNICVVIATSFARIHKANLINSGILPLTFNEKSDYLSIEEFDVLIVSDVISSITNQTPIGVFNKTKNQNFTVDFSGSKRDIQALLKGGTINRIKGEKI